jgi:hypothetical protein
VAYDPEPWKGIVHPQTWVHNSQMKHTDPSIDKTAEDDIAGYSYSQAKKGTSTKHKQGRTKRSRVPAVDISLEELKERMDLEQAFESSNP